MRQKHQETIALTPMSGFDTKMFGLTLSKKKDGLRRPFLLL
jgi:hypothetical protein